MGNYWSDYKSKYPNAIEIDSSGIGNIPYVIDDNNADNYPLMQQLTITIQEPTPTPISGVPLSTIEITALIVLLAVVISVVVSIVVKQKKRA